MWIFYAFGSALFAGLTSILAKCGIRHTDSDVATAIRTIVVLVFSWIMVFVVGAQDGIAAVSGKTWLFLILSGFATGASWLCYFHALQAGDVNKVVPIDKSSTILTIVLAFLFLGEEVSALKIVCVILISVGTFLMIRRRRRKRAWGRRKRTGFCMPAYPPFLQVSLRFSARSASRDSIPISERQSGRRWCL